MSQPDGVGDRRQGVQLGFISLTNDDHEKLNKLLDGSAKQAPKQRLLSELVHRALNPPTTADSASAAKLHALRGVLDGLAELDLDPHPCPANVDPDYWDRRDVTRLLTVFEQAASGIRAARDLVVSK